MNIKANHILSYLMLALLLSLNTGCYDGSMTSNLLRGREIHEPEKITRGKSINFSAKVNNSGIGYEIFFLYSPNQLEENEQPNLNKTDDKAHCLSIKKSGREDGRTVISLSGRPSKIEKVWNTERRKSTKKTIEYLSKVNFTSFKIGESLYGYQDKKGISLSAYVDAKDTPDKDDRPKSLYTEKSGATRFSFHEIIEGDQNSIKHECYIPNDAITFTDEQLPITIHSRKTVYKADNPFAKRILLLPFAAAFDLITLPFIIFIPGP